jgi:hypothetical protein
MVILSKSCVDVPRRWLPEQPNSNSLPMHGSRFMRVNPDQKQRMRFLAVRVLRVLHNAVETRRMQDEDSDED